MLRFNKAALLAILFLGLNSTPAFASPSTGLGASLNVLSCQYSTTLPTLTAMQTGPIQCDASNRVITAPQSLLFSSPLQTYGASGVGADTAFPSSVSTSGTSLGALPTGASRVLIHLPPGSSVSLYVAPGAAANATAAALVSETYNNASANTNNIDVTIDLNGELVYVTNYTSGTASSFISGKPVYRFI